jgi:hypothetical protein
MNKIADDSKFHEKCFSVLRSHFCGKRAAFDAPGQISTVVNDRFGAFARRSTKDAP